jgi:MFS family permease
MPSPRTCVSVVEGSSSSDEKLLNESRRYAICLAILACVQNSLVGGLIFGWASIDRTLLAEFLTPNQTTRIFSWASFVAMVSTLVLGTVHDMYGPRWCSIVSHVFIMFGCLLFAIASSFALLALASCLIGTFLNVKPTVCNSFIVSHSRTVLFIK